MTQPHQEDWSLTGTVARTVGVGLTPFVLAASAGPVLTQSLDVGAVAGTAMFDTSFLVGSYPLTNSERRNRFPTPHPDYAKASALIASWLEEDSDLDDAVWPELEKELRDSRTRLRE